MTADLDGDGDLDVLVGSESDHTIGWFANQGDGSFGPRRVISGTFGAPDAILPADLDGDGDPDVAAGDRSGGRFSMWLNDGLGNFGSEQVLAASFFSSFEPSDVQVADLDGDETRDIVVAWRGSQGNIGWFRGLGGGAYSTLTPFGLDGPPRNIERLAVTDLDGDGDTDVAFVGQSAPTMGWAVNEAGDGSQWEIRELPGPTTWDIAHADFDDDGDTDLAVMTESQLRWLRNDGAPVPTFQQIGVAAASTGRSVVAVDFDGDGDTDLVSGHTGNTGVQWHENDGETSPTFAPHTVAATDGMAVQSVAAGNFDSDCGTDVAVGAFLQSDVLWFRNGDSDFPCGPADLAAPYCVLDLSDVNSFASAFIGGDLVADLNGDGILDLADVIGFIDLFLAGCLGT